MNPGKEVGLNARSEDSGRGGETDRWQQRVDVEMQWEFCRLDQE